MKIQVSLPRARVLVLAIAVFLVSAGMLRTALFPEDDFLAAAILDDAVYNVSPARNLVNGYGYSFDRLHKTNGVQPLWALYTLAIVAVVSDDLTVLRILVLTGCVCWLGAGLVLYRTLRRWSTDLGLIAAVLWIICGLSRGLALQGLEMGITALCLVLFLAMGLEASTSENWTNPRFCLRLGFVAALISLCRVEMLLLPSLFCLAIFFGWLPRQTGWRQRLQSSVRFGMPTGLLFGIYVACNLIYFGGLAPVSGAVKAHHSQTWLALQGWPFGGFLGNLSFHLRYPWDIATIPISMAADHFFFKHFSLVLSTEKMQFVVNSVLGTAIAVAAIGVILAWRRNGRERFRPGPQFRFLSALLLFVAARWAMLATLIPYFTLYGIWYFSAEILLSCVLVDWMINRLALFARRLPAGGPEKRSRITSAGGWVAVVMAILLVVINAHLIAGRTDIDPRNHMMVAFKRAGEWLNDRLPEPRRIATLTSGVVNMYARKHNVINLDGVMNDYDYLENYLKTEELEEYVHENGVSYLADHLPIADGKRGFPWGHFPLDGLQLVRWWVVPDGTNAYMIWRRVPTDPDRDFLAPCPEPCDRLSQIQFAAAVLKRYRVVSDREVSAALSEDRSLFVATSFQEMLDAPLTHVLMGIEEYRALKLKPAHMDIGRRHDVTFGDSVRLLGFDAQSWRLRPGQFFVVTQYWEVLKRLPDYVTSIDIYVYVKLPGWTWLKSTGIHGSLPFTEWKAGDVFALTHVIPIAADIPSGDHQIRIGVWSESRGWLPTDSPSASESPGMYSVGDLTIRR